MEKVVKRRKYDYFECERCKNNTLTKNETCPCPRGSCEAICTGQVVETVIVIKKGKNGSKS